MDSLVGAAIFLIKTLFSLYLLAILLRFLLQIARADFYNPLSQAIVKITDPALRPLRRIIPGIGGIDLSSLTLALIVQVAAICLVFLLLGQSVPNFLLVLSWAFVGLAATILNIYFFALIIVIVLSWVAPQSYSPGAALVQQLTDPIMRPARNLIPPIGGLDLSPIFIFIAIKLIEHLVIDQLALVLGIPRQLILGL
ncbi:MAG: YggT family protein [Pseudomonadales bacterium]|nr:YggT family protein [Pseudomonadales bacterium]MCP5213447.1 YggT family protein [Pseudomonadales bacterium]